MNFDTVIIIIGAIVGLTIAGVLRELRGRRRRHARVEIIHAEILDPE